VNAVPIVKSCWNECEWRSIVKVFTNAYANHVPAKDALTIDCMILHIIQSQNHSVADTAGLMQKRLCRTSIFTSLPAFPLFLFYETITAVTVSIFTDNSRAPVTMCVCVGGGGIIKRSIESYDSAETFSLKYIPDYARSNYC